MAEQSSNVIKFLFGMGVTVTINQTLAADTAEYLVREFGHNPIREKKAEEIENNRLKEGADGAILKNYQGSIHEVNFFEKILTTILAKLSNFIPGAGIWMNTQRPEWNDANNALVGSGVSMVTLWLPGSAIEGMTDVIFTNAKNQIIYDFKGNV